MRYRQGCGPRGHIEIDLPDAMMAMRGGRGWQGSWGPFHFDIGDSGWSGGRRRHGRRRKFDSGKLGLVLLKLIADEPRHGYELIKAIEELTGGEYSPSPGMVYPILTMLQDMGTIEEVKSEGSRKPFQVTDDGRTHLEANQEEVEALFEHLEDLKPDEHPTTGLAIGRAVKNLMTALSHRISADGLDEDLLHEIAAVLDDAAQRIERIK